MILTEQLEEQFSLRIIDRLSCPACLSPLYFLGEDKTLICKSCENAYPIQDGFPVMLVNDENFQKKADEIQGEQEYNVSVVPQEVHDYRNSFEDENTQEVLDKFSIELSEKKVLLVGCSIAELMFFSKKCQDIVALDIVPSLVKIYQEVTEQENILADWVCGDGECLPFEDSSFDVVIIRQALHHMIKYYSAIFEFFRVCKIGGSILVIDEPMTAPDFQAPPLSLLPDHYVVYDNFSLGDIRNDLRVPLITSQDTSTDINILSLETLSPYIEPQREDAESFLADKYLSFSLLESIFAFRLHTHEVTLHWPERVSWTEQEKGVIKFVTGRNPNHPKSTLQKLSSPGNISIFAKKTSPTTLFRDRSSLQGVLII